MSDDPLDTTKTVKVDFQGDGLLWLVNKTTFHPRGFALARNPADGEFYLLADGTEPITFDHDIDDEFFPRVEALLERARENNA